MMGFNWVQPFNASLLSLPFLFPCSPSSVCPGNFLKFYMQICTMLVLLWRRWLKFGEGRKDILAPVFFIGGIAPSLPRDRRWYCTAVVTVQNLWLQLLTGGVSVPHLACCQLPRRLGPSVPPGNDRESVLPNQLPIVAVLGVKARNRKPLTEVYGQYCNSQTVWCILIVMMMMMMMIFSAPFTHYIVYSI